MHDSHWHGYVTFGWIATIIGLLLFGALGNSYRSREYQSSYYKTQCAIQYKQSPFANIYRVPSHAKPEAQRSNAELPGQPDWCDLAAQQSVAEDTTGLHAAAWAGVITGLAGIWLLIWTLVENRRVSLAAIKANEIAQNDQRPWMKIENISIAHSEYTTFQQNGDDVEGFMCTINYRVRNIGKSPAYFCYSDLAVFNPDTTEGIEARDALTRSSNEFEVSGIYLAPGDFFDKWGLGSIVQRDTYPPHIPIFFHVLAGYSDRPGGPRFVTMISSFIGNKSRRPEFETNETLNVTELIGGKHIPAIGKVMCFRMD